MSAVLPAGVIAAIEDLELAARLVVEGLRAGAHRSPMHGFSSEFQQHRAYRAGDDLKYLDWKLLARTDRLYTRVYRETTSMSVMLVVDASGSMNYPDSGTTKWRYAQVVAAALAHLVVAQGDAVGLLAMSDGRLTFVPAKGGRPHLRSLIAVLGRLTPAGTWEPARAIARGAELLKRRGLIVALSDFEDSDEAAGRELRRAGRAGHDVAMLQVIAAEERTFPYRGDVEFEDLESGDRRRVEAGAAAGAYRAGFEAFLQRCRERALRDYVDYALMPTDLAPERALRDFLLRRHEGPARPRLAGRASA
jgi:uncharacterized protein (DUF58 family)